MSLQSSTPLAQRFGRCVNQLFVGRAAPRCSALSRSAPRRSTPRRSAPRRSGRLLSLAPCHSAPHRWVLCSSARCGFVLIGALCSSAPLPLCTLLPYVRSASLSFRPLWSRGLDFSVLRGSVECRVRLIRHLSTYHARDRDVCNGTLNAVAILFVPR